MDGLVKVHLPVGWRREDNEEVRVRPSLPGANWGFGFESELELELVAEDIIRVG